MGLFDPDLAYQAYSGTVRLIDPDDPNRSPRQRYPNTLGDMVLRAIYDQANISDFVVASSNMGYGAAIRRMTIYAAEEYIYRLPAGSFIGANADWDAVYAYISGTLEGGAEIDPVHSAFGPMDNAFYTKASMKRTYLDSRFFAWTTPPDTGAFSTWDESMTHIDVPIIDASTGEYWHINNNPTLHDFDPPVAGDPKRYIEVREGIPGFGPVEWQTPYVTPASDNIRGAVNLQYPHYQISYKVPTGPNPDEIFYFYYDVRSNLIPELDPAVDPSSISQYMPIAVLMRDQEPFNQDPDSELAVTTRKLLDKIHIDADEVLKDFMDEVTKGIADGDIAGEPWDVFIQWAVPINAKEKYSKQYLFKFFKQAHTQDKFTKEDYDLYLTEWGSGDGPSEQSYNTFRMTEASDTTTHGPIGYRSDYRWCYVESVIQDKTVAESGLKIGQGTVEGGKLDETDSEAMLNYRALLEKVYPGYGGSDMPIGEGIPGSHDFVLLTQQISQTQVEYLIIMALDMRYTINTSEAGAYNFRETFPTLFSKNSAGKWTLNHATEFVIPISLGLIRQMTPFKREKVLSVGMHATAFFVVETEIPWYKTGAWTAIIVIITIILIVLFQQYELVEVLVAAVGAVGAAATYVAWIVKAVITYMITLSGQAIGGNLGMLVVILGSIYMSGGFQGFQTAMVDAWKNVVAGSVMGVMNFIVAIQPMIQFLDTLYTNHAMGELQDEMRDWGAKAKDKEQELKDAWSMLGLTNVNLNPMDIVKRSRFIPESHTDFYTRTLNTSPGTHAISLPSRYYNLALRLPEGPHSVNIVQATFAQMANMTSHRRFA